MQSILISAAIGYFLGSIPFGYILVRVFRGADVRASGSGNIGATNVARTSPVLGIATLLLDAFKGAAAVWLTLTTFPGDTTLGFVAAVCAVCGHIFPVWLHFHGGKGVATGLGSFLLLIPKSILLTVIVFLFLFLVFRYVSVASVMAAASLPLLAFLLREPRKPIEFMLIFISSLLIVAKHRHNIRRLMSNTEPKFQVRRK